MTRTNPTHLTPAIGPLIGRAPELSTILLALRAGKSVLLEGPVGTGKTHLAQSACEKLGRAIIRIDGDSRYSEQKLVGYWDPQLVLSQGYNREAFHPGPLTQAMEDGAILFINELNRMPESVQNILLPALDEGLIHVPQLGQVRAHSGFALLATQNPRDFVGTSLLSEALLDRLEWVPLTYPSEGEEIQIVKSHLRGSPSLHGRNNAWNDSWIALAVALIRLTRQHPKIKRGASIRAAIALAQLLEQSTDLSEENAEDIFWSTVSTTLPTRIEIQPGTLPGTTYSEQVLALIAELRIDLKKKSAQ